MKALVGNAHLQADEKGRPKFVSSVASAPEDGHDYLSCTAFLDSFHFASPDAQASESGLSGTVIFDGVVVVVVVSVKTNSCGWKSDCGHGVANGDRHLRNGRDCGCVCH